MTDAPSDEDREADREDKKKAELARKQDECCRRTCTVE
jgi:hypothetical protein